MLNQYLENKVRDAVRTVFPDYTGPVQLTVTKDIQLGDYASPVAFSVGKQMGITPKAAADAIAIELNNRLGHELEATVSPNAPFINLKAKSGLLTESLIEGLNQGEAYATHNTRGGQYIIIEFISANPTGPLTLANGRGGFAGDALANVFAATGANVEREYYYNDSGNQIMELGRSVVAARAGVEIEGGYKGPYIQDLAQKITEADPYQAGQLAADFIFNTWIKPMITRMGVEFTRFSSEQSLIDDHTIDKTLDLLTKEGLIYEKEGALWIKTMNFGDDKDRVIRRSDGTFTYFMKDIAYHMEKINRKPAVMMTIVGADHFAEAKALDMVVRNVLAPATEWPGQFSQPIIQFVRLLRDGQEVRMSKRAGNFVTIDDLLEEINPDVARFFFLMRGLDSHMDFDLDLAKASSDENPVYYVQYALVRAKHILEKHSEALGVPESLDLSEHERRLLLHIFELSRLIDDITVTYDVHKLTYYAIELAKLFHAFYTHHPVLKAEGAVQTQRLALTQLTLNALKQVLRLIGVSQPDRMVATTES